MRPALHDQGSGPAIVFLHAFPMEASQWDHQVAALSDRHRCLRPDFWGCGESPAPPEGVRLEAFAEELLGMLDERGVSGFSVVGLSLGGYIALELLRQAPERILQLVLADTRATADTEAARDQRSQTVARVRSEGIEALVESTVEGLLGPTQRSEVHIADPVRGRVRRWSPAGVVAAQQAMADRRDSTGMLPGIAVPTLVIGGSEDTSTPPDSVRGMAAAIPGARFQLIKGAGHLSNLEKPFAFTAALEDFLSHP